VRGFGTRALPLLALGLFLNAAVPQAEILMDFEQAYYVERDSVQVKDHAVVFQGGLYHVFFIQSLPQEPGEYMRTERWLGHITSPDLRHWTHQDSILPVVPGTWESKFIWAPKIIESPIGQGWWMYYTGADEDVCQRIGLAFSSDLFNWVRSQDSPVYVPGRWADWEEGDWANCRDPEVFAQDGDPNLYLFSTALTTHNFGALGLATSQNGLDWEDSGTPFFVNDDSLMIESTQMVRDESGLYHLFFHEQDSDGTYHIPNSSLTEGWDIGEASYVNSGRGAELTRIGDEWLYTHFNTVPGIDGPLSFLSFDFIDIDTDDDEPDIITLPRMSDSWRILFGTAFDFQPTWGDNPYQRGSVGSRMEGNSYIATYEKHPYPGYNVPGWIQGNDPVGLLKSDPFTISADRIGLLVGGGAHPDTCFVGLFDAEDHRLLFTETGMNSDRMLTRLWKTETLIGRRVYLAIADMYDGQWGNIAVDSIEEYWFGGHEPGIPSDPIVDGPTLFEILENAGFGGTAADELPPPVGGRLLNAHPNPFNPSTSLGFVLDEPAEIALRIHDASGRTLRRLWEGPRNAGGGTLVWDGRDDSGQLLPSGLYFASLLIEGRMVESRKLVLLK